MNKVVSDVWRKTHRLIRLGIKERSERGMGREETRQMKRRGRENERKGDK